VRRAPPIRAPFDDVARFRFVNEDSVPLSRWLGETIAYVRVQCYSGVKADERPIRFELDGREYLVEEILDHWYGPDHTFFKLVADDHNVYILRHSPNDLWSLESFRTGS